MRAKLEYLRKHIKNPQAIKNVYEDYKNTRKALEVVAGSIHESESEKLRIRDLKRINFQTHNYFMLFRIRENRVEVTDIFHGSEDYENKLR